MWRKRNGIWLQGTGSAPRLSTSSLRRSHTAHALEQHTAAGPAAFAYDADGKLTSGSSACFVYDAQNRFVSASGG